MRVGGGGDSSMPLQHVTGHPIMKGMTSLVILRLLSGLLGTTWKQMGQVRTIENSTICLRATELMLIQGVIFSMVYANKAKALTT